jgi:hypothetical protein
MKNILLTILLIFNVLIVYSTPNAPSTGVWVMVDTSYNVGTNSVGLTKAKLYFENTTSANISGMQFRVFYDKVAFGGAKPIVSLLYSGSHYMQYVADSINGNITITLVYTGSSSTFNYPKSEAFEITFTHANPSIFQTLSSIDSLKVTGAQVFPAIASTINGNDTALNLYSYGGVFNLPRLAYSGKFINVTGTGSKNIAVSLEKRPKNTTGAWVNVKTTKTDSMGLFAFNELVDTTFWDAHLFVKGDTMNVGTTVSVADAQKVNKFVLRELTPVGFDFYSSDVNGNDNITVSDVYTLYGRLAGRFTSWPNNVKDVRFFSVSEYNTINTSSVSLQSTIPGVTNLIFDIIPGQPDSVNFYVLGNGDANGTGFNMARITPIEILNPSKAPRYIIDEIVKYDFKTDAIEINMPQITVNEGNMVSVPVKLLSTDNIGSMQLALAYDKNLLNFKEISTTTTTSNWFAFTNTNDGVVEWGGFDNTSNKNLVKNNEILINLNFLALSPQVDWDRSPLYVIRKFAGDKDAKDLSITPTNGVITIRASRTTNNESKLVISPTPNFGKAVVNFSINSEDDVFVGLYNNLGVLVYTVFEGRLPKGEYLYPLDITNLPAGIYNGLLKTKTEVAKNKTIKQ